MESGLFYIAVEDNQWSLAIELIQKEAPYDDHLSGLQGLHFRRYLDGMKTCLLERLPSIGIRTGAWTSGVNRPGGPGRMRKKVSELEPGDVIRKKGVAFTVKQVLNSDAGKTLILFEDMPATEENMEAYGSLLKKMKELNENGK